MKQSLDFPCLKHLSILSHKMKINTERFEQTKDNASTNNTSLHNQRQCSPVLVLKEERQHRTT
jgi:hypothetical protein